MVDLGDLYCSQGIPTHLDSSEEKKQQHRLCGGAAATAISSSHAQPLLGVPQQPRQQHDGRKAPASRVEH
ncbi:hypothetical protein DIPPA_30047 [Diplonema papillatum]|nr:hypothetical protein DIPPA_30047 [Diplonema papillatum]